MNINIKATGFELTPAISDYIDKKITTVEKYLGEDVEAVVVAVEVGKITKRHKSGEVFKAEVHISGGGHDFYVSVEEEDLYAAIDKVKDDITREIRRTKGKEEALAKKGGALVKNMMKGFTWSVDRVKGFKIRDKDKLLEDGEES